ncbi:MAG: hypothetical protein HKO56_02840, partial [Bacteroidia bacterium]|nr:hypothetical protein [Bacteroidia bacterium]
MKRILLLLVVCFIAMPSFSQKDSVAVFYSANINAKHISKYMHRLVSKEFAGRETGEPGQKLAAQYIADEFKKSGALPGNGDSYFQNYDLMFSESGGIDLTINGTEYGWLEDFYTYYKISNQTVETDKVLFLGYGIQNKRWDSFKDLDITNKVVLVLEGEPKNKRGIYYVSGNKRKSNRVGGNRAKVKILKGRNPAAIIIATNQLEKNIKQYEHWINRKRAELPATEEESDKEPPVIFISYEAADKLMESKGIKTGKLSKTIQKKGRPTSFYVKTDLSI